MSPDEACYALIRGFEGCVLHPYLDIRGIPTIGIGTIMYDTGKRVSMTDPPITMDYAEKLLEWQVKLKTAAVNGLHILFNQNEFNALCSFTYNEGVGALQKSTIVRLARQNTKDPAIGPAFALWNKIEYTKPDGTVGYVVSKDLVARRAREYALYSTTV